MKILFTPDRITELNQNEIFVFGSNIQGQHNGGAAFIAWKKFGAQKGEGIGLHGQTYAIPTMHGGIADIKPYVDDFIQYALIHTEYMFLVTRIGCGIAGFSEKEMAPLFSKCMKMDNVILPKSFVGILIP